MLRQLGKHYRLLTFVSDHNVASRLDKRLESSQRCNLATVGQDLVAKTSAFATREAKDCTIPRPFDKAVFALENFQFRKYAKLHRSPSVLSAHETTIIEKENEGRFGW